MLVCLCHLIALTGCSLFTSGTDNSDGGGSNSVTQSVYYTSSVDSEIVIEAISNLKYDSSSDTNEIPDLYVVKAEDDLTAEQGKLLLETILADKAVIIVKPTRQTASDFVFNILGAAMKWSDDILFRYNADPNAFSSLLLELNETPSEGYEAIAIKDMHLYYVHKINEGVGTPEEGDSGEIDFEQEIQDENQSDKSDEVYNPSEMNVSELEEQSAAFLSEWLKKTPDELGGD